MMSEFCLIAGADENKIKERWMRCQDRVIQYAPLEQKRVVKQLLNEMKSTDDHDEGNIYIYIYIYNMTQKNNIILLILYGPLAPSLDKCR